MILNSYGADAVSGTAKMADPAATTGQVLVQAAATSVNTVEMMIRQMGKDLPLLSDIPALLGMDFAGTVEMVGEGVTGLPLVTKTMAAPVVWPTCPTPLQS